MTLHEIYLCCLAEHWSQTRFVQSGWQKEVVQYWERHIRPTFGNMLPELVSAKMIRQWHRDLQKTPTTANRCLEVLSKVFTFAEEEEYLKPGGNPCRNVKAYTEKQRARYATENEIKALGRALTAELPTQQLSATFCIVLLLTGARPRSLMEVRRDQLSVEGETGILRFHGKTTATTGEEEVVIVPPSALFLLQALPVRADGLLIGPVPYRRFWKTITAKCGCSDLWLRDLRRTFATVGMSSGVGKDWIGRLLNHKSTQTTDRYAKMVPTARIEAAGVIGDKLNELMGVR